MESGRNAEMLTLHYMYSALFSGMINLRFPRILNIIINGFANIFIRV